MLQSYQKVLQKYDGLKVFKIKKQFFDENQKGVVSGNNHCEGRGKGVGQSFNWGHQGR